MEVKRIFTKLKINNKVINKNFEFRIIKQINSLIEIANIKIKKEYFEANELDVKYKDSVIIFLQINEEPEIKIFSGVVLESYKNKTEYCLVAENSVSFALSQLAKAKSYINTNAKSILNEFCNSLEFDNDLNIMIEKFFALCVQKRLVIKTLLNTIKNVLNTNFYCFLEDKLQIKKELKGKTYKIDDYIISLNENKVTIFPLPGITLEDKVSYKGREFNVKTITMTNRNFVLEIV